MSSSDREATRFASGELALLATRTVRLAGPRLTIGRDERNDLVLADPNVSRFHAELTTTDAGVQIVDLGSRNGTRVDGQLVEHASVSTGTQIGIGPFRLLLDGADLMARDDRGALRLDAEEIAFSVDGKQILAETSLAIEPGQLVVVIGESGAGKSTLLKALAGVRALSAGRITVNGEPIASRSTDIGYVPQDEIVHGLLTVREALRYAARLRLPGDASNYEIDAAVERVLTELSLAEHADTRIASLSGGQRKRAGVAAELLSRPSLLFLDEPTTGLDPGLETAMMELLRALAANSRAVTVVTHATKNLTLCDRVVVMGRGGERTFHGPPDDALRFFDVEHYDDIYSALSETPAREWRRRFEERATAASAPVGAADGAPPTPTPTPAARRRRRADRPVTGQGVVLAHRYARLLLRDQRNLALLIGQAPLLALAGVVLFKGSVFERPGGNPADAAQLLFLLVLTVVWLGSIDAAREVVKERGVFDREAAVGVRLSAYLASKIVVLFTLVTVQTVLYTAVLLAFRPLHEPVGAHAVVLAILLLTGLVGVGMGLCVSAAVRSEDQATSIIPLVLIPQLLFAGTIVPVERMGELAQALAALIFARWSLASLGTAIDMNERIAEDPRLSAADSFGSDFFDLPAGIGLLILAGFLAAFLAATVWLLRRRKA